VEQSQEIEHYRELHETSERKRVCGDDQLQSMEKTQESLRAELLEARNECMKVKHAFDDTMRVEATQRRDETLLHEGELEKWKTHANHFEQEYKRLKQLNGEMTKMMSQMTTHMGERSEESGDVNKKNRTLLKQLEQKSQELKTARFEKEEMQKQFDSMQSHGTYFQEKFREAQNELKTLKQEHSVSTALAQKLKGRVELLQQENDAMTASKSKLLQESRSGLTSEQAQIEKYTLHLKELEQKVFKNDEEMERSHGVSDSLKASRAMESSKPSYEPSHLTQDGAFRSDITSKKSKAQTVIGRLNNIMTHDDDRSSRSKHSPGRLRRDGR